MQVSCWWGGGGGTANVTENKRSLRLVADAYCLLEVYKVLKSDPAAFGLPDDLRDVSPRQSEKRKDKKPKEQQTQQVKRPKGHEVTARCAPLAGAFTFMA